MNIEQYVEYLNKRYQLGNATEHTFRGDLQNLIESLVPEIAATNEPKRIKCGAPDYVITRKEIPIGFIEAKDIGTDLSSKQLKEQFERYRASLDNLIITDYIDFHLYIDGAFITSVKIADIHKGAIISKPENFATFTNILKDFCSHIGQTIKSSKRLAEMMAGKARMLSDVIEKSLNSDEQNAENSTLRDQMTAFKQILIHDIKPKEFADVYAQTIAYGMFAARLHDPTLKTFTRQEAAELIPKSNPFLRKLFGYIAGIDIDDRIKWIVDSLADIFRAADVAAILKNFGKSTQTQDPIIHFYETFLSEYDPKLRKARGVWYTPEPVVNFIVRAVDDILKTEFNLPEGLADTSKTEIEIEVDKLDARSKDKAVIIGKTKIKQEIHRVQILDPATGTGTFLAEVIKQIHNKFEGQEGIWSNYVENHLLPRLNGFELLMASYAMAHLKLDLLLTEMGYKPTRDQRFKIYLTNSLEEFHQDTGTLFANWLSSEANEANQIKRDTPVMCIIGNPPYSVSSTNKNEWIENLTADYKKELNEKNIQPLSDDYIKFIRLGQHFIDKKGSGVLAYISNNSFIDGIIHRQMRKSLLESFDKIYVIDLHGNTRIKEISPDGNTDQNVFDIMAGVSINIFIKNGIKKNDKLGNVFHSEVYGSRENKYNFLMQNTFKSINWGKLNILAPEYLISNKDYSLKSKYNIGFPINEFFIHNNSGLATEFDELVIHHSKVNAQLTIEDLQKLSPNEIKAKYSFPESKTLKIENAIRDIKANPSYVYPINYRPFDIRYCIYTGHSNGIMGRPRNSTMQHFINNENLGLIVSRSVYGSYDWYDVQLTKTITEKGIMAMRVGNAAIVCPLYTIPQTNGQFALDASIKRKPNFNIQFIKLFEKAISLNFINEKENSKSTFSPIDIFDYIYSILHSPSYRRKYKEFLKIDFPRIPYPKDQETFWQLVKLGGELRQIHLLESPVITKYITKYPIDGNNIVIKPKFEDGKVFINETQFFEGVPSIAWEFYIGGYQPAQKWLKDRKDRKLEFEDILHYQKIIVALSETDRIMKEIDKINFIN